MNDGRLGTAIRRALAARPGNFDTDVAWRRLESRIRAVPQSGRRTRVQWPRLLAAAAVVLTAGLVTSRLVRTHSASRVLVERTSGSVRRTVRLDDGSTVTLAPQTTLRFHRDGDTRVAELAGHASFSVTHDERHPFVVRFAAAEARDVGTEFVVRSFAGDSTSIVAVVSGEVAVRARAAEMRLGAGQAASVSVSGTVTSARDDAQQWVLAWMRGRLVFRDQALSVVVRELGRWFDVQIEVPDRALAARHVSAVYSDATIVGVLDAIAAGTSSRYTRTGRVVVFTPGPARP